MDNQPWDSIVEAGWGPAFAAASVLKNLRDGIKRENGLESARWYYRRLVAESDKERWRMGAFPIPWTEALHRLSWLLTDDEKARLA